MVVSDWQKDYRAAFAFHKYNIFCDIDNFNYIPGDDCWKLGDTDAVRVPPIYCLTKEECHETYFKGVAKDNFESILNIGHSSTIKDSIG